MRRLNPYAILRDALDPVARDHLGTYLAYEIDKAEYVTTVCGSDTRNWLRDMGYGPQYLSAAKRHADTGAVHWLSYAKRPEVHPFEACGTALDDYKPSQSQYHVHVFANGDVFSHYELSPTLRPIGDESIGDAINRLREHYRPTYGETLLQGVSDLQA